MIVLPRSRPLTRGDLTAAPDDGHRYELVDGSLVVTPAPSAGHQRAVVRLAVLLDRACPPALEVLVAPFDVALGPDTVLQPDVLATRRADLTDRDLPVAPLLAVEVLSPSTRLVDRNLKRARYEAAGTPSFWVVDPDQPALTAWGLSGGQYVHVAHVVGADVFRSPVPAAVEVVPARLVD
ncbi:Uma2 family endonuclease [Georgenia sp. TF02-10]|uniref:Uma2 family endonuclease n=1 Tax=Georgenia sp. TF02-10 TaxID=2917725 RepID=UPI001FA7A924|nr:Uma2 family endonuclease [Georgenia sp. TF02-10]UNX54513.1 Uma2 family endonuclease [Georgenia sp. TF02-10]